MGGSIHFYNQFPLPYFNIEEHREDIDESVRNNKVVLETIVGENKMMGWDMIGDEILYGKVVEHLEEKLKVGSFRSNFYKYCEHIKNTLETDIKTFESEPSMDELSKITTPSLGSLQTFTPRKNFDC